MTIKPLNKEQFMEKMQKAERMPDLSEGTIERFWDWVYADLDGLVQTCAFPVPTENQNPQDLGDGKWVHARTLKEYKQFCDTHSGLWRYHVYSGVNTLDHTPERGRGGVDHIDRVNHLSFDIETERESYGGATKREVWWTYRYALAQIKYMSVEYGVWPLVVMSENGIHLHYKVDFPCIDELLHNKQHIYSKYITHQAMDNRYVRKILNHTPEDVDLDQDDVSDPPRVMKVPGTKGIKSENGRLCGIIHEPEKSTAGVIKPSDVDVEESFVEELEDTTSDKPVNKESVSTEPSQLTDETIEKVKRKSKQDPLFKRFWEGDESLWNGADSRYPSRSETEMAFVIKMLSYDFSQQQIINVMWASGMSKWDEESDHYRQRTISYAVDDFDGSVIRDSVDSSLSFSKH